MEAREVGYADIGAGRASPKMGERLSSESEGSADAVVVWGKQWVR